MDSLLPVGHAPILRMYGGAESLLPATHGSLPPIASMSGGASLLPIGNGDIHAMSGGGSDGAASFGITDAFSQDAEEVRKWKEDPLCSPITETNIEICPSLSLFVDRRVQALLKRVNLSTGHFDMGCGTIERKGVQLSISFDQRAITLLSSDFTRTFAAFRDGMSSHQPDRAIGEGGVGMAGMLQWMLGTPVIKDGPFDLITFMKDMSQPLPLDGFIQFLSYHADHVDDMMICKNAMALYGYYTGAFHPTERTGVYGWIFPPDMAARRVGDEFEVYSTMNDNVGVVTNTSALPSDRYGFTVYDSPPSVPAGLPAGLPAAPTAAVPTAAVPTALLAASPAPTAAAPTALLAAPTAESTPPLFSGIKIDTPIIIPDQQKIGEHNYTLRGMIQHDGGMGGGHYTYLYHDPTSKETRQQKGPWIIFNDASVSSLSGRPDDMIDTGYIYLFQKDGPIGRHYKGITNHGNSCWMNAVLQMFYHIPEYREYIEKFNAISSSNHVNAITLAIQEIFLKYSTDIFKPIECSNEYSTLFQATFPDKPVKTQQDAMEFIDKVLLVIIEKTPIRTFFEIQSTSIVICENPWNESTTDTSPLALRLPIPDTASTLDDLLDVYVRPQQIEDYKVDTISCPTAMKTETIKNTAKYVIIQLNRFGNMFSS